MHPLLARPERLAAYLGGWLIVGVLIAGSLSRQGLALSESLVLVLPLFLIYSFICLSAWYVCRAVPLRTSRVVRVISAWVVSAAVAGGLWLGLTYAWIALLGSMPGLADAPERYGAQIPVLFTAAVLLFLLALVVHYLGLAFEETREAEQRQFALQVQKRDAELRALRAQLDPHFLYNCLNSIAALTTADAAGARRMCLLLGEFLRRTLHVGAQSQISLGDELALVDRFLAIEQVRFGSRLQVSREIDARALGCRVPPLFLQPLLENAVKHGIADMIDGGIVQLQVALRDDHLAIRIVNPCDPDALPPLRTGTGMTNVRQRLLTSFGPSARMTARAEAGQFHVELELPVIADDQPSAL